MKATSLPYPDAGLPAEEPYKQTHLASVWILPIRKRFRTKNIHANPLQYPEKWMDKPPQDDRPIASDLGLHLMPNKIRHFCLAAIIIWIVAFSPYWLLLIWHVLRLIVLNIVSLFS